jgi:hypothetical protein
VDNTANEAKMSAGKIMPTTMSKMFTLGFGGPLYKRYEKSRHRIGRKGKRMCPVLKRQLHDHMSSTFWSFL